MTLHLFVKIISASLPIIKLTSVYQ